MENQKQKFLSKVQDPDYFTSKILQRKMLPFQLNILRSVRDNPRTAVRSCHGIGKTFTAASCVLWFLYSHKNSIVLSTAPTWRQVEKLIWKEIRNAYAGASIPLGGELMPKSPSLQIVQDEWYAAGLSTNEPDRFQGFHEEHILIVVDEAAGISNEIYEAIEGILTSAGARILLIGNPTAIGGGFYEAFQRESWSTFHISAFDTPNFTDFGITQIDITTGKWKQKIGEIQYPKLITPAWVADKYLSWGESSAPYQVRVLGNFPEQGEDTLIPIAWIEAAMERYDDTKAEGECRLGVDVAGFGNDATVVCVMQGRKLREITRHIQMNTNEIAALVSRTARRFNTRLVNVDNIGIGQGVCDNLENRGYPGCAITVSERSSQPDKFLNLRAELWWNMREAFDPTKNPIAIPYDDDLLLELSAVKYRITARGLIQLEMKDEIRRRIGRSPDKADALALALYTEGGSGFVISGGRSITADIWRDRY